MISPAPDEMSEESPLESRRLLLRHVALTLAIFAPLLLIYAWGQDFYPLVVYRMFYGTSTLEDGQGYRYFVFGGETLAGDSVEIPPITIVNALDDKFWSTMSQVVDNESLRLRWLHPDNAKLVAAAGGVEHLPEGARLPDLLRALGNRYNAKLPADSPRRLKSVRLNGYVWPQKRYGDYANFVRSWSVDL